MASEDLFQVACRELDEAIRRGGTDSVESILSRFPTSALTEEQRAELIYTEFVARKHAGEDVHTDEYFRRFPELESTLQELFYVHQVIHDLETNDDSAATLRSRGDLIERPSDEDVAGREGKKSYLGHFELGEELGAGAFAIVYKARDLQLNRLVALKVIRRVPGADQSDELKLRKEAEAAARLKHVNIVQIYDINATESCRYIAMELIEGGSLLPESQKRWLPARTAEMVKTLARAVQFAHDRGVVHRDLKPASILLDPDLFTPIMNCVFDRRGCGWGGVGSQRPLPRGLLLV